MINASQGGTEGALPEELSNLISVANMISHDDLVIAFVVIIPVVVGELVFGSLLPILLLAAAFAGLMILVGGTFGVGFLLAFLAMLIELDAICFLVSTLSQEVYRVVI